MADTGFANRNYSCVLKPDGSRDYPVIARSDNIYLYDTSGKRYIDATSGPVMSCLGYGLKEFGRVLADQVDKVPYAFRLYFSTEELEAVGKRVCDLTGGDFQKVFMTSGGSEAMEIAVKLARKYHVERQEPSRYKVISRWLSYHGGTQAALSWSGMPKRRADYGPMLQPCAHIPPAYCYRCWFGKSPETCELECAQSLEKEILCQGSDTVAAFIAEPVSGTSLCAAVPRQDYFRKIREICDRYGVLLIFDEIMTGFGRTGKWFAYEHFGVAPDILAVGKAMGAGYFPVGAALLSDRIVETFTRHNSLFYTGYTWAGNPMAAAVVCQAIAYQVKHGTVARAAVVGERLKNLLMAFHRHPTVGDTRGIGCLWGIEFVKDKRTKESLDPTIGFCQRLYHRAMENGLYLQAMSGCDDGKAGDMVLFAPAYIVTDEQLDEIFQIFDRVLTEVEAESGLA